MPGSGFGGGPFGHDPFGEANWAWSTLWGLIPERDRAQDAQGYLYGLQASYFPSFNVLRRKIRALERVRDPRYVRTQYDEVQRIRLGPRVVPTAEVEQYGIDGYVDGLFQFHSPGGRFREMDLGKEITVRNSVVPGNNRVVRISTIVDLHVVTTDPVLATDAGLLRWELRQPVVVEKDRATVEVRGGSIDEVVPGWILDDGRASFRVSAKRRFLESGPRAYLTEREGRDGILDTNARFYSATAGLSASDTGKFLSLHGSEVGNDGRYEVLAVDTSFSPPRATLRGFILADPGPLEWAVLPRPQLDISGPITPLGLVDQEGTDLVLAGGGTGNVSAASAVFSDGDVGKYLTVLGSPLGQNGKYRVSSVTSPANITVAGSFALAETALTWELRPATYSTTIEVSGADLKVTAINSPAPGQSTVVAGGPFDVSMASMSLVTSGSSFSGNNGSFAIVSVEDPETLVVSSVLSLDDGPLRWQVESGDRSMVQVRAESMIQYLAPDFGLEVDFQETEVRQRSLVEHVNSWLAIKGHESAYQALANASGFNAAVSELFHIDPSLAGLIGTVHVFEVGDVTGRHGTDGALESLGSRMQFSSASTVFAAADVGVSVRISNAVDSSNNGRFTIDAIVDEHTVVFRSDDVGGVLPDYGIGGTLQASALQWLLVRLYTDLAPAQPVYDEINVDTLEAWVAANVPGKVFGVDRYCWESDFVAYVDVVVTAVVGVAGYRFLVSCTGPADVIPKDPIGGTRQRLPRPAWVLIDGVGGRWVVETAPDVSGGGWEFEVVSDPAVLPALGLARLEYQCQEEGDCRYCRSSVVAIVLEYGSVLDDGAVALERVLERLIDRLSNLAKPKHVRLLPILQQTLEASLSISAEIDANIEIYPTLIAPVTALYDVVAGDDIACDVAILAEVEVP